MIEENQYSMDYESPKMEIADSKTAIGCFMISLVLVVAMIALLVSILNLLQS